MTYINYRSKGFNFLLFCLIGILICPKVKSQISSQKYTGKIWGSVGYPTKGFSCACGIGIEIWGNKNQVFLLHTTVQDSCKFTIEKLELGKEYSLNISGIGKKSYFKTFTLSESKPLLNLGNIQLLTDSNSEKLSIDRIPCLSGRSYGPKGPIELPH